MKTIGVLGGLGPQATMDFEARVHEVSQRLIPQHFNAGYPPMIVHYCRYPPIRLNDDGTPVLPMQPDPRLLRAAQRLATMCDFLVITSNTPHILQKEIERTAGRKVLSMIDLVISEMLSRRWKNVGVLGFGYPHAYAGPFSKVSIAMELARDEIRSKLDEAVRKVMEGRNDAECRHVAQLAVNDLRSRNVDGIVLGCTEIPLMLGDSSEAYHLINPMQLLAKAAVEFAMR